MSTWKCASLVHGQAADEVVVETLEVGTEHKIIQGCDDCEGLHYLDVLQNFSCRALL